MLTIWGRKPSVFYFLTTCEISSFLIFSFKDTFVSFSKNLLWSFVENLKNLQTDIFNFVVSISKFFKYCQMTQCEIISQH